MSKLNSPMLAGFDLELLQQHAATEEGREFLRREREKLQRRRDMAAANNPATHPAIVQADDYLQRFALVLDSGGTA